MSTQLKAVGRDLKSQTHLGTVAAAKASKLELGVLGKGFAIKQAQSKGLTSVVKEAEAPKRKTRLAFHNFSAPFRQSGLWIDDASGASVGECISPDVAKEVVKALNIAYPIES